jgi:hypothetical protein
VPVCWGTSSTLFSFSKSYLWDHSGSRQLKVPDPTGFGFGCTTHFITKAIEPSVHMWKAVFGFGKLICLLDSDL